MWRWEKEFYSDSGIFGVLVGIAGTSGKVLGAADLSGAASKEPQGSASPGSLLLLPWRRKQRLQAPSTWSLEPEAKPNCARKCQGSGTVATSQQHH